MSEKPPLPIQDFAVSHLQERGEVLNWELPYSQFLETAWSQFQVAFDKGRSKEEMAKIVLGIEEILLHYWLHQMIREEFVPYIQRSDTWILKNDQEEVQISFLGGRGDVSYGYNGIHFTRRTDTERSRAQFYYQHHPSECLLLTSTDLSGPLAGPLERSPFLYSLKVERGRPAQGMLKHMFTRKYPISGGSAELIWIEGNPSSEVVNFYD